MQTRILGEVVQKLSESLDGRLEFGSVRIVPFNTLVLKDAVIIDENPYTEDKYGKGYDVVDTLGQIRSLTATFTLKSLLSDHGADLSRVVIDGGQFNLVTEVDREKMTNLERVFHMPPAAPLPENEPDIFRIRRVKIRNFRYSMKNFQQTPYIETGIGINWEDMDVVTNIDIHDLRFSDLIMSGTVDRLDCVEKSGYRLESVTGHGVVGRGRTTVTDLRIKDEWSDIRMPFFEMRYKTSLEFADFLGKVSLEGVFARSTVGMQTVKNYSGVMDSNTLVFDIRSGHASGPVNDMTVKGMNFEELTTGVRGSLDCHIKGVEHPESAVFDVDASSLAFTTASLSSFIDNFAEGQAPDLGEMAKGQQIEMSCRANGPLDRLDAIADLDTPSGFLHAEALLQNIIDPDKDMNIEAFVRTRALDAGALLGIDEVGRIDCEASAGAELLPGNIRIRLDSLSVDSAELLGHCYRDIFAKGGYGRRGPYGTVVVNDPALKAIVSGEDMHFVADIPLADLAAMNLDTRPGISKASLKANLAIEAKDNGKKGCLDISGLTLENDKGKHKLGRLRIDGTQDSSGEQYSLESQFIRGKARLKGRIGDLLKDLEYATTRRELYALHNDIPENRASRDCDISLDLYDTREVISLFVPDLYISDKSSVDLKLEYGTLDARLSSRRIALGDNFLKDIELSADNRDGRLNLAMDADELNLGGLAYNRIRLDAFADDNDFDLDATYCFNNQNDKQGRLDFKGYLERNAADELEIHAKPDSSHIYFGGKMWRLSDSPMHLVGKRIIADGVELRCGDESVTADGALALAEGQDTMTLRIRNLDMGIARDLFKLPAELQGSLSGDAILVSPISDKLRLAAGLSTDEIRIDGISAGTLSIESRWDERRNRISALVKNDLGGGSGLNATAFYSPSRKEFGGRVRLDGLRLDPFAPFVGGIFSRLEGGLSGEIDCNGTADSLAIVSSGAKLENVLLQPAFTGVTYTVDGPFSIADGNLEFDALAISDGASGSGSISGGLSDFLHSPVLGARLSMNNIKVLDMSQESGEGFYGRLSASGRVAVDGPFDNLQISGEVRTAGPGEVHIPLNASLTQSRSELLTFVQKEEDIDPYEEMRRSRSESKKTKGNLRVKAHAGISPDVVAYAEIDKSSGNLVSVSGTGDLDVDIDLAGSNFQVDGDYNISSGYYHFAIPGLIGKDLTISDGGSIKFGGDIMESQLDLTALYSLKTSLAPLSSDTTSVSTRRQVNCSLNISDKIKNPAISFGIDIPDLDPTTESSIRSALNTEDKVQKQFISLLVFNTFLPSESSGVINSSNMLYANMTEMFSGQVNNILQKLEIPLDLGFGYQADDGGTDIFDVAVSTQLFNNRVVVGGSVGNRKYSTSASANGDVVGDLDIEVKIDRAGQFRFKLFSHSADEFTSFLDYSQRNGAGVTFQKEYDRISDIFKPSARRAGEDDTVTIKINE